MKLCDFDYYLPQELIAQTPANPRDSSRLLAYDRKTSKIEHMTFSDLPMLLREGDLLVANNTRVIPARLIGRKDNGGASAELLLLKRLDYSRWQTLVRPGKKIRPDDTIIFSPELRCRILDKTDGGGRIAEFAFEGVFEDVLARTGTVPLPHYIKSELDDAARYQTVYCKTDGSAAAPTAGLHFTPALIDAIKAKGVEWAEVLLHVGLGTFRPVKSENVVDHVMHSEYFEITAQTAERVNAARRGGRRIIAVGTTAVRVLESAADESGLVAARSGETDIFIYPPYRFKAVDGLITNFHLPQSTLIMLVSAFAGREETMRIYNTAVQNKYRFFSFGDSTIIL